MSKFGALLALYFAQGLPFGFQATALPLILRERGVSLEAIGFASLLSVPWLAKALWAPLVDRYGSRRFGRRKSWIVPMQAALALCVGWAAHATDMRALTGLVLMMNLFAATQDIAVDALAVAWLRPHELGPGNAIQVVGYKLGMLTGGGLLVWASGQLGWRGVFYLMGALMLAVLLFSASLREPPEPEAQRESERAPPLRAQLVEALRKPASAALVAIVVSYKLGETLADGMWKPMLVDRGFALPEIGLWTGTFGMLCSLAGSSLAGLAARRVALADALLWTAGLRALGVAGEWWISATPGAGAASVIAVTCAEHFVGGAITTVVFALMMRHTDRRIGATHYTLLASLEVWGKLTFGAFSGVLAVELGYQGLFALAAGLSLAFILLARALHHRIAP